MEDYPKTLIEFESRFSTEEQCREYLIQKRWPNGFNCPKCNGPKYWIVTKSILECSTCKHHTRITAGTIFQDSHLPLTIWFRVIWWVTSQKDGASALGLKRILGLSYKTSWMMLHKLRRAMVRPGRERLSGFVEVDETYLGSLEEGLRGRQIDNKAIIIIVTEFDGHKIGRIRMKRIPDASSGSLQTFINESIEQGSIVYTDAWAGYSDLKQNNYSHKISNISRKKENASDLLPNVHMVASLLKRWLMSTHQGAISHEHLDYYLDEYVFRFNRRSSQFRGKLFYRLIQQSVEATPVTFKDIRMDVKGIRNGKHQR
jgi:transposase-like protein